MKPSEQLFELIKSLTKQEKRYFNLFAKRHIKDRKSDYLKLFEAIEKQQQYDESIIRETYKSESFTKHLSEAKYYLYQLILKCLRAYSEESSPDVKIMQHIYAAELLFKKGLGNQAIRLVAKGKQLALENERFQLLVLINEWEVKLIKQKGTETYKKKINTVYKEGKDYLQQLRNIMDHQLMYNKAFELVVKYRFIRTKKQTLAFQRVLQIPESEAKNTPSRIYAYNTYGHYYFSLGEYALSHKYFNKILQLFYKHPDQILLFPGIFSATLHNLILQCIHINKYQDALILIRQLRNIYLEHPSLPVSKSKEASVFVSSYNLEFAVRLSTGDFQDGIKKIEPVKERLVEYEPYITLLSKLDLYYAFFCLYFGVGNYKQALEYLNRVLNDPQINQLPDLYAIARIVNLIVHYELGNHDILENLIRAAYRTLRKEKRQFKAESVILDFIRKHLTNTIPGQASATRDAFLSLKKDLGKITQDPFEAKITEYFDFMSWLDSKLTGKSFAEIVKSRSV